jgi:hypothetical protein
MLTWHFTYPVHSSQVFVRLHHADMVAWVLGGIFGSETAPSPGSDPQFEGNNNYQRSVALPGPGYSLINWKTAGFDDIIGRNFSRPEIKRFLDDKRVEHVGEVVYHTAVDIWPGLFRPSVTRKYYANVVKASITQTRSRHTICLISACPDGNRTQSPAKSPLRPAGA